MNTYGVGVENASRILGKYYPDEDSFFRELMEAEKRFIRTRKFWD
jgi:ATP-dependent Lhr-like helicase